MNRAGLNVPLRMAKVAAVLCAGVALIGCQSVREAAGVAKLPPDEFTVLTKAPLVLPPDYNLRPPQPGIASRSDVNAEEQARSALFQQNVAEQVQALGSRYSDGEKLLLQRTGALSADPNVRRSVTADVGLEDQGPAFAQQVLFPQAATASPTPAQGAAPAAESVLYPQANTSAQQAPAESTPAAEQAQEKRSWWRRIF